MATCRFCQSEIHDAATVCPECGRSLKRRPEIAFLGMLIVGLGICGLLVIPGNLASWIIVLLGLLLVIFALVRGHVRFLG